jgi:hypothetical protein
MISEILTSTLMKVFILIFIIFLAYRWQNGSYDKQIKKIKKLKKSYGLITIFLIIIWWLITPSGSVDDVITIYLINLIGMAWFILVVLLLTLYILWRLRINITIYK